MDDLLTIPPEMLMGEAGICGFWAMVAIAHVYQRNQQMTGWQDAVNEQAKLAASTWWLFPDPTDGARYVFSTDDLRKREVRALVRETGPPKAVFQCLIGRLAFY